MLINYIIKMPRYKHPPFSGTQFDKLHAKLMERHLARGIVWDKITDQGRAHFKAALNLTPFTSFRIKQG